jgi:hypothetical protein
MEGGRERSGKEGEGRGRRSREEGRGRGAAYWVALERRGEEGAPSVGGRVRDGEKKPYRCVYIR